MSGLQMVLTTCFTIFRLAGYNIRVFNCPVCDGRLLFVYAAEQHAQAGVYFVRLDVGSAFCRTRLRGYLSILHLSSDHLHLIHLIPKRNHQSINAFANLIIYIININIKAQSTALNHTNVNQNKISIEYIMNF